MDDPPKNEKKDLKKLLFMATRRFDRHGPQEKEGLDSAPKIDDLAAEAHKPPQVPPAAHPPAPAHAPAPAPVSRPTGNAPLAPGWTVPQAKAPVEPPKKIDTGIQGPQSPWKPPAERYPKLPADPRRAQPAQPQPHDAAPSGAAQQGPLAGISAAASEAAEKLRVALRTKGDYREELKQELLKPGAAPQPMKQFNSKEFTFTPEQAKRELDPRNQLAKLLDIARDRPYKSAAVMALALLIFAGDILMLMRKLNITQYLPVSIDSLAQRMPTFWQWERRGSALSYLDGSDKEVTDPAAAAAVSGPDKVPADTWEKPPLPGDLAGIMTPEEMRNKSRAVMGISPDYVKSADSPENLSRTMIVKGEDFSPYQHAEGMANGKDKVPSGVYMGKAGELLENFAAIKNSPKSDPDVRPQGTSPYEEVPEGLAGEELVMSMLSDDLAKSLKDYAKEGTWKMKKTPGAKQNVPEYDGSAMLSSIAVGQLIETKRATDRGLNCATCDVERRIHNTRATFYGEKHK